MESSSLTPTDSSSLSYYLSLAAKHRLLTAEQEKSLANKIKIGCQASRNELVTSNLRLVIKIAKRYQNRGVPLLDLIEEGNLGVIRAAEGFDPAAGCRFSTYSAHWIRHFLENAIREKSGTVRLPDEVYNYALKVKKIMDEEPEISEEELSKKLDISTKRLKSVTLSPRFATSISQSPAEGGLPFSIPVEQDFDKEHLNERLKEIIKQLLEHISERDAYILTSRFGLDGRDPQKLEDIGITLGISRERVRQVEQNVLKKMKSYLSEENINFDDLVRD